MKNLKVLFTVLCVACATSVWGEEELLYTLTATKNTSNSSYSSVYDVTINKVQWSIPGNQALTTTPPWKFGGKLSSATDRILYSKGSISGSISKIILTHGSKDTQITVKSCTVSVFSKADDAKNGSNPISSISATYVDNGSMTITKPNDVTWKDCYYRIVYNLSSSASSKNCGILFSKAEFYGSSGSGETTVSFTPSSIGFGTVTVGETKTQDVSVTIDSPTSSVNFSVTGSGLSVSPGSLSQNGTVTVTYKPTTAGTLNGTLTASGGGLETDVTATITGTAQASATTYYTVTWMVGGQEYIDGNPTTSVAGGSKVTTLPTAPADNSLSCAEKFMGWSKQRIIGTSPLTDAPTDLFTTAEGSPDIIENTTFYAVFATPQ